MPTEASIITSTWDIKRKANGTFRARLNAREYGNMEGVHYDGSNIALPVTNDMIIGIIMVLDLMAGRVGKIFYLKGELLHGEFEEDA